MKKHIIFSVIGLVVGLAALWWLRPDTSAGATFLLTVSVGVANALALLMAKPNTATEQKPAEPGE